MPIRTVTRSIDLAVDVDRAWDALATPEGLAAWLGDAVLVDGDDALRPGAAATVVDGDRRRRTVVSERVDGDRLAFTWWDEAQPDDPSTVRIELEATVDGTRVTVTETADAPLPVGGAGRASMSVADVDHLGSTWDARFARLAAALAPVPVAA